MYLGPWNPLPILSVDGREQTRHRLRPKSHSHWASASAVRRSTGWRGPQPTARESGELSKMSVIWLGVHPGTCKVSSSCQWCSLCSSCASLQSFSRQTTWPFYISARSAVVLGGCHSMVNFGDQHVWRLFKVRPAPVLMLMPVPVPFCQCLC